MKNIKTSFFTLYLFIFSLLTWFPSSGQDNFLIQARHSQKVIQATQAGAQGTGFQQWDITNRPNQQFTLTPVEDGYYRIAMADNALALDIEQSSIDNGIGLIQWPYNRTPNQQFKLEPAEGEYFYIQARHSGKYLDVEGGWTQNGARLIQYEKHGGSNQQFRFLPVAEVQKDPQEPRKDLITSFENDMKWIRKELLQGVNRIAVPGVPGPFLLFGEKSYPIVVTESDNGAQQAVVAAALWEQGRVVTFGHNGYFGNEAIAFGNTEALIINSIHWAAAQNRSTLNVGCMGPRELVSILGRRSEITASNLSAEHWENDLAGFDVICVWPFRLNEQQITILQKFVRRGGGLLAADLGWGWQQLNPDKDLMADHPGNQLLKPAGIAWSAYYANTPQQGYEAGTSPSKYLNVKVALDDRTGQRTKAEQKQNWMALGQASSLGILEQEIGDYFGVIRQNMNLKAPDFPAAVPASAERISTTAIIQQDQLNKKEAQWLSTGFYAAPGEMITLRFPEEATNKGLTVQIGAHSDQLWHKEEWERFPDIIRSKRINSEITSISSPFGGLIYIKTPGGLSLNQMYVHFENVLEAPSFVLGKNSLRQWQNTLRYYPAPWGELITDKVILTIPSDKLRALDDPERLMQFWDRVLDLTADLAVQPRERDRPERFVPDQQISAGYMHSGYPIMTHLDAIDRMISIEQLQTAWGLYHELGHNHQQPDWTFDGTVEVTCNLFTLYVREKATNISPRKAFMDLGNRSGPEAYFEEQKRRSPSEKFPKWKADPFLALAMYIQLQEAFGWEAYFKVFEEYRDLPFSERPRNDDEKRDQWMVRFSKTVGKDLSGFFDDWGVPVSAQARRSVAYLPDWRP